MSALQSINQLAVPVTTSLAPIGTPIPLTGRYISLAMKNVGANALTHFQIYRQFFPNGDWILWLSDADFATATSKCSCSGGASGHVPNTLGAGNYAWMDLDCGLINAIQIWAQAGTATTVNIIGQASQQWRG